MDNQISDHRIRFPGKGRWNGCLPVPAVHQAVAPVRKMNRSVQPSTARSAVHIPVPAGYGAAADMH